MSDKLTIRTNHQPRPILYWWDLTEAERKEFDYRSEDDGAMYVRYKGVTYDLSDFMRWSSGVTPQMQEAGFTRWDGYASDSFFSGVLCRFVDTDQGESVIMGTYYS
jgi:predicted heme/steroid binding protein